MITEHCQFQMETTKLGRDVDFKVMVFERRDRRGKRLFAETQCSDPNNFLVQFVIRDASAFEEVLTKLQRQMIYRGYVPLRYRVRQRDEETGYERWLPWNELDQDAVAALYGEVNPGVELPL